MTLSQALTSTTHRLIEAGIPADEVTLEAHLLLMQATGMGRTDLFLNGNTSLKDSEITTLEQMVHRRERREPLAYILGERGFYGLSFKVSPGVLIPRPETELLVEVALSHLDPQTEAVRIADIGTGSGCIAIAIAVHCRMAEVDAVDISPVAVDIAVENARRNGVSERVHFKIGDLASPLSDILYDAIVSNPPYIAPEEIERLEPEVRDFEPRVALGENSDTLHFYRRLASEAPAYLKSGGLLAVEVGQGQAEAVAELWQSAGLVQIAITADLAGIPRVVAGKKTVCAE